MTISNGLNRDEFPLQCTMGYSKHCIIVSDTWVEDNEENRKRYKDWVCIPCYAKLEEES